MHLVDVFKDCILLTLFPIHNKIKIGNEETTRCGLPDMYKKTH